MMDRATALALDRWITREPDYDARDAEPLVRCATCGRFCPARPVWTVTYDDGPWCDGKVTETEWGEWMAACSDPQDGPGDHEPHLDAMVYVNVAWYRCSEGHLTRTVEI